MTAANVLSSAATIHAARLYVQPGQTVAHMIEANAQRKAWIGLYLANMIDGAEYPPPHDAGPYSDRYRHELQFLGLLFDDEDAGERLYRNVQAEEGATHE